MLYKCPWLMGHTAQHICSKHDSSSLSLPTEILGEKRLLVIAVPFPLVVRALRMGKQYSTGAP